MLALKQGIDCRPDLFAFARFKRELRPFFTTRVHRTLHGRYADHLFGVFYKILVERYILSALVLHASLGVQPCGREIWLLTREKLLKEHDIRDDIRAAFSLKAVFGSRIAARNLKCFAR